MVTTAYVNIWGKRVGAIAWNPDDRLGHFEFDPGFLKNNWDLSPLKMPIAGSANRVFSFPGLRNSNTFRGLPGLLADILPDYYGNALINVWLAKQNRPANSLNPVEMLCFIGERGMGALEIEPAFPKANKRATHIEISSLVDMAREILSGRKNFTTQIPKDGEKDLVDLLKIGTSAGGARAKAVIGHNPKTGEVRSGQTNVPKGFGHWLIKFDGVIDKQFGASDGYGRVEMAYHLMAVDAGIEMAECKLLEENGRAHFMTKRFDRVPGVGKVHVQTFCAMQHYDFNDVGLFGYEQLFETMRALGLPYPQAEQMYRRMVFNIMGRNCDDHTKNFAFAMDQSGQWGLAPAYDVCHAYRPGSNWVSRQSLSINGKMENFDKNDLLGFAKKMNIKKAKEIIQQTAEITSKWKTYAQRVGVNPQLAAAIEKTLVVIK